MSYLQYNDYYRKLILSGQMPFPPYYLQTHVAPNIVNENCEECYQVNWPIVAYPYAFGENHEIYNLCYTPKDRCLATNDYCSYYCAPFNDPSNVMAFRIVPLVSNISCECPDPNLLNSWNSIIINDIVWVTSAGTGLITQYNLLGASIPSITINVFDSNNNLAQPTGIVCNPNLQAFLLYSGPNVYSSTVIVATRNGTINGYNPDLDPCNSIVVVDNCKKNCVYTGLELGCDVLYVTDFYNKKIDVFDHNFKQIDCSEKYQFVDECSDIMPNDFAPYNIVNIGEYLYVLYAKQNARDNQYECIGRGEGYINIFTFEGKFVRRFISRGVLNVPYGIILAPELFGYPAGAIIVGNFGDGILNVFTFEGVWLGCMSDACGISLSIQGLRGLRRSCYCRNLFYWCSSTNNLSNAFVGTVNTKPC